MICKISNKEHDVKIIKRDHEFIFIDRNNNEIANITVNTMNKNSEGLEGRVIYIPTENFFLIFNTIEKIPLEKNIASVFLV